MDTRHLSGITYLAREKRDTESCIKFICEAKPGLIHSICAIIKNILLGELTIDKDRKYRLKKHLPILRKLAERDWSDKKRRSAIQENIGLIASLIDYVLPQLNDALQF